MKVGIITFWQTRDNYGQILQNYALQQALIQKGHSPYLIRYAHSEVKVSFTTKLQFFFFNLSRFNLKGLFLKKSSLPPISKNDKKRDFDCFKKTYLSCSEEVYYSLKELRKHPPKADAYVVGSDQVWSKTLRFNENKTFFLDFGPKDILRIAYAASFAMPVYPRSLNGVLKKMLMKFAYVSVREKSGVDICKKVGITAKLVLDPTLLLRSVDYEKCLNIEKKANNDCFIYCLNISSPDEIYFGEIKKISKENNLKIVVTPASGYISSRQLFDNVCYRYHSIKSWIEQIASSKLVVTTSFHGIVFCILFHTPFVYIPLKGGFSRGNNRILDLLSSLNLQERCCECESQIANIFTSPIDWNFVEDALEKLRDVSEDYLLRALND